MPPKPTPYTFKSGFVQSRDVIRVIGQIDKVAKAGSAATQTMKWSAGDRQWSYFALDWTATRLAMREKAPVEFYTMGPLGAVLVASAKGHGEEHVDSGITGPQGKGEVRDLRWIGDHLYVAGMSRQVYRRDGPDKWSHQDADCILGPGKIEVCGFNALDGLSESDVLAVGFNGEIWRRLKNKWRKLDSPTNVVLHRVRVVEPGLAFACGQGGALLRGTKDVWRMIDHEATEDDLWGMEIFKGHLYVSSDDAIYRLDGDKLIRVKAPKGMTCRHLHANDGILASFGTKNVAWTPDASAWNDITP